jgi:hypothetical protein
MVQYWRDRHTVDEYSDFGYGEWFKIKTRPPTPPAKAMPSLTPNERVQMRNVLPPPAHVKNKAEKRKVKLKRGQDGKVVSLVAEPVTNDFFNDVMTSAPRRALGDMLGDAMGLGDAVRTWKVGDKRR